MENIDYIVLYISGIISLLPMYMGYSFISGNKFEFTLKNIILVLISTALFVLNTCFNIIVSKTLISFFIFVIFSKLVFHDDMRTTISSSLLYFLIMLFSEFMLTAFIVVITKFTYLEFNNNGIVKGLFTIIVSAITYFTCRFKFIKRANDKLIELSKNNYVYLLLIFLTITFVITLSTKLAIDYNYQKYILDVIVLIIFASILSFALFKNYKANKESDEKENLLEFISKYEKIIDENRINKHEMLNNLIILRSFKNKNSKEYNKVLDDLIVTYDNNSDACVKNISKLPTGLKGILYYKVNDMRKKGINLNINISKRVSSPLEKLPADEYVILSKILGIVMDNALEASLKSEEKIIVIEVFEEAGNVIISIENTYSIKVNINDLKKKNFSTKGKNRGLGLYIANILLKKSKHITMEQKAEELFTTIITIK